MTDDAEPFEALAQRIEPRSRVLRTSRANAVDFTGLPDWDLWANARLAGRTAEWGLDAAAEKALRAARARFVAQAREEMSARYSGG